jgi:ubiquinone/menaquinone biosynthesis C-methylase UbiE
VSEYRFVQSDFEHPSFIEVLLEETVKNWLGGLLFYNAFAQRLDLAGDERVLDFGCGSGVGARCIARRLSTEGHLTGVDTSAFWLEKAGQKLDRYPNVELRHGDIRTLEIPDGTYDVIAIAHVIHDIAPQERAATVAALARKLKPEGVLRVVEPTKPSHGMAVAEIRALMAAAGLEEIDGREKGSTYTGAYRPQKGEARRASS